MCMTIYCMFFSFVDGLLPYLDENLNRYMCTTIYYLFVSSSDGLLPYLDENLNE